MKKCLAILALTLPMVAMAGDNVTGGFYAGGGVVVDAKLSFEEGGSYKWVVAEAIGGYKHSPFVGGEARLGYGSKNGLDILYSSFYYRAESSNDTAKTYLLLGYSLGQLKFDAEPGEDGSMNLSGFSYGIGVGFPLSARLNVNLEYRVILDGNAKYEGVSENVELSGGSLGIDYRF